MTLPALGVIGLTFLCILLVGGVATLVVLTNDDLRFRLCEMIASYRSPPKEDGSSSRSSRSKKKSSSKTKHHGEIKEDMYTSRVPPPPPPPMELQSPSVQVNIYQQQQRYPPQQQYYGNPHSSAFISGGGNPYASNPYQQQRVLSTSSSVYAPRPAQPHQASHSNYSSSYSGGIVRDVSGKQKSVKAASGEHFSSGTNSPHDSALGSSMNGQGGMAEMRGILKQPKPTATNSNGKISYVLSFCEIFQKRLYFIFDMFSGFNQLFHNNT